MGSRKGNSSWGSTQITSIQAAHSHWGVRRGIWSDRVGAAIRAMDGAGGWPDRVLGHRSGREATRFDTVRIRLATVLPVRRFANDRFHFRARRTVSNLVALRPSRPEGTAGPPDNALSPSIFVLGRRAVQSIRNDAIVIGAKRETIDRFADQSEGGHTRLAGARVPILADVRGCRCAAGRWHYARG